MPLILLFQIGLLHIASLPNADPARDGAAEEGVKARKGRVFRSESEKPLDQGLFLSFNPGMPAVFIR
jgi:hypothetical protein